MPRIRAPESNDFDAIARITNHYISRTAIHFAYDPVTADELRAGCKESHPWRVCEVDGAVVGFAKASTWRERDAYRFTAETGVYLDAAWAGRGLGRPLYEALIAACEAARFRVLVAGIALPNEPSVRLHERLGFRYVGTFGQVGYKFEAWHDVGFWERQLPARTENGSPVAG